MIKHTLFAFLLVFFGAFLFTAIAQPPAKKANTRRPAKKEEPFEKATKEKMAEQCVRLETEAGNIEAEMFPESAPETVRNFLNLVALKAFDTTTFSRVVPGFVIQGGNAGTRPVYSKEIYDRMIRNIPDEPNQIKHERGILSMARGDEANSASSNFFILVGEGSHLDGKFAAFGRVTSGMDIADKISKMAVDKEKPLKPVTVTKVLIIPCVAKPAEEKK